MDVHTEDILHTLEYDDLLKLRAVLKNHCPYSVYAYNFINNCVEWKQKRPDNKYLTVWSPNGNYKNGTFICLSEYNTYDLFLFTLSKDQKSLYDGLTKTKRINWSQRVLFYTNCIDHVDVIKRALRYLKVPIVRLVSNQAWTISREKLESLDLQIPDDIYIASLKKEHIPIIDAAWPHQFPGSEDYLWTIVELNYGYGLFLKSNDELAGWVIKNQYGAVGVLQVSEKHYRKGYGSLLVKFISKRIVQDNIVPVAFIVTVNNASNNLFAGLGFDVLHSAECIFCNKSC